MGKSRAKTKAYSEPSQHSKKRTRSRSRSPSEQVTGVKTRKQAVAHVAKDSEISKELKDNVENVIEAVPVNNNAMIDNGKTEVVVDMNGAIDRKVSAKEKDAKNKQKNKQAVKLVIKLPTTNFNSGDEVLLTVRTSDDEFQSEFDEIPAMNKLKSLTYSPGDSESESITETMPLSSGQLNISQIQSDPVFKELVNKAVAEQMQSEEKIFRELTVTTEKTPVQVSAGNSNAVRGVVIRNKELIKSPSDTTIYAPALNKVTPNKYQQLNTIVQNVETGFDQHSQINAVSDEPSVNRISQFVEQIRMSDFPAGCKAIHDTGAAGEAIVPPNVQQPGTSTMYVDAPNMEVSPENQEQAWAIAGKLILDAEKY